MNKNAVIGKITLPIVFLFLVLFFVPAAAPILGTVEIAHAQIEFEPDVDWQATYWNNVNLFGAPLVQRTEEDLDFDWGAGSPHPAIAPDRFSARWTTDVRLDEGLYRFVSHSDDGIRVWVDSVRIIDNWTLHAEAVDVATIPLNEGLHGIRVDYFENTGLALASLEWELVEPGVEETVDISPVSGPPGTVVQVTAMGFTPNVEVTVGVGRANSEPTTSITARANEAGEVQTAITIPEEEARAGEPWVVLVNNFETGERALSETFTVTGVPQADCGPTYEVQPDDWLTRIARRCDTTVDELLAANPQISNPSLIFPGQVLNIPAEVPPPQVGITPNQGDPGTEIQVNAIGFPANNIATVAIGRADSEPVSSKVAMVDAEGMVETTIAVPAEALPGTPWVVVVSSGTVEALSETFTVSGAAVTATTLYNLNFRPLPTVEFDPGEIIPVGTVVPVLGRTADNNWFLVLYEGQRSWIAGWLTRVQGDLEEVPIETP